jgi:hypothetical protein
MRVIRLKKLVGSFAEDKDKARDIRIKIINPILKDKKNIILDFKGIDGATQSFIHALISELIREEGPEVIDMLSFRNCNENVKKVINIVVEYMQA